MVTIVKGAGEVFTALLKKDGQPFDLSLAGTVVTACFLNADGTTLSLASPASGVVIVAPAGQGKITVTLTAVQTALLKEGLVGSEILVDATGIERQIFQLPKSLDVKARICP
jgi:hypothetical protein